MARALLGMLVVLSVAPAPLRAQLGQTGMAPPAGLVNGAVTRLTGPNSALPGFLYYGVNAADRGLGYLGSYMTLGGFFPGFDDDLGGFWSADLRGHLSTYGGFFSNVGAVRKQFIGGTLLGVGVYWDYDGDQNQYGDTVIDGGAGRSYTFGGGESYNQVGVSGEWLTDWGNLRSNGYIPVGQTATIFGPFIGNRVLCANGINAALGGADLEVGAYVPGLADWAGMVSVGGYALGNTRYQDPRGGAVVPWFGGVYTRLDMTFARNWDFSLQANNDSYFDWTGFARLTYRMGSSRRRNVPDQMEQPMMRNEHIVRAHQTPEVAINPFVPGPDGQGEPYRVFYVDNSKAGPGDGTAENPYVRLDQAESAANRPYDIVYVSLGDSLATPYLTPASGYSFQANNQFLIGQGSNLVIDTFNCGPQRLFASSQDQPLPQITNPLGTAVVLNQPEVTVATLQLVNTPVGITDAAGGSGTIYDVTVQGNGGPQRGILLANSVGPYRLDGVRLNNLRGDGVVVSAASAKVDIANSTFTNVGANGVLVSGSEARVAVAGSKFSGTRGTAVNALGPGSQVRVTNSTIQNTSGTTGAIVVSGPARLDIVSSTISSATNSALVASGSGAKLFAQQVTVTNVGDAAIEVTGEAAQAVFTTGTIDTVRGSGVLVNGNNAVFRMNASTIRRTTADGVRVENANAFASLTGTSRLSDLDGNAVSVNQGSVQLIQTQITNVDGAGINAVDAIGATSNRSLADSGGTNAVWVQGVLIENAASGGILATDSNLRVEPNNNIRTRITVTRSGTSPLGIAVLATKTSPRIYIDSTDIEGTQAGITVANIAPAAFNSRLDFTAIDNIITLSGTASTGMELSASYDPTPSNPTGSAVNRIYGRIRGNVITSGTTDISLITVGGPTFNVVNGNVINAPPGNRPITIDAANAANLGNLNNGCTVAETPAPANATQGSVNYQPGTNPPLPPLPPPPPLLPPP